MDEMMTIEEMMYIIPLEEAKTEDITYRYVKPLKDKNSIRKFYSQYKVPIDGNTVKILTQCNGGRPSKNLIMVSGKERVVSSFLSYNHDDKGNIYSAKSALEKDDPSLVPFARDPFGNFFCFKRRQIVFFDHETANTYKVAGSFIQFMQALYSED